MRNFPNEAKRMAFGIACVFGFSVLAGGAGGQEEAPVNDAYPLSRYEGLWRNSLFGPGKQAPVAVAAPSNLSLVGVFEVDGVEHAVVMNTADGSTEEINSARASGSGSRLAMIESSSDPMETRVQIDRGGSLIWVGYNLGATTGTAAMQAKAERLRALQERQRAEVAAAQRSGGSVVEPGGDQPGEKPERPRTVVLPSTIPLTARPE